MATRPSAYPIWTQGNNSVRQQPTDGEQFTGFVPNFRPPSGLHNWLFGIVSDWIAWLDYATQGNGPVSNSGHNYLTGTTVQTQFDETDAVLSLLSLVPLTLTSSTSTVYTTSALLMNSSKPMIYIDGLLQQYGTDYTYAVVSSVGTVTFAVAPASGSKVFGFGFTG